MKVPLSEARRSGTAQASPSAPLPHLPASPVFLTAPMDLQRSDDYEAALATLLRLHPHGRVVADRDLFEDLGHWKKTWRKTYDGAAELHVLCREDGTVGLGVYRQWRRLALKNFQFPI